MTKQVFLKTFYIYVIPYFVLLTVIFSLMYAYPKPELHMMLNSHHTGIQDTFFKYYSTLAEWPLYILALLPLLWKKRNLCNGSDELLLRFDFRLRIRITRRTIKELRASDKTESGFIVLQISED